MPSTSKKIGKKNIAKKSMAVALHMQKESVHAVGIGNIKVILFKEDGMWIAQGLEIDYAAYGKSKQKAKSNFEAGLQGTIDLHIKIHQNIKHLLKIAPAEIWEALCNKGTEYRYSQMTLHNDLLKALHP